MAAIGAVYVLFNEAVPGFVKVGMSADVERRVAEINSGAGVIGRWMRFGHIVVNDMRLVETTAHEQLRTYKGSNSVGTEIFSCSKEVATQAVRDSAANADVKIYEDLFPKLKFRKGADVSTSLFLPLELMVKGGIKRLGTRDIEVPAGTRDGATLRFPGNGLASPDGGEPGDLLLTLWISPSDLASMPLVPSSKPPAPTKGANRTDVVFVPPTLLEKGGLYRMRITHRRVVNLKIPAGTRDGATLRFPGKGHLSSDGGEPGDVLLTVWASTL